MTAAQVSLPPKLLPVFSGEADIRGAYGGRGSGKTRSFAKMTAVRAYIWAAAGRRGQILCCRQLMKTLADSSLEEVRQAIKEEPWLAAHFDIGETYIRTTGLPGFHRRLHLAEARPVSGREGGEVGSWEFARGSVHRERRLR